jgi:hypothetical protein
LWTADFEGDRIRRALRLGAVAGLAVAWSYDSVVLVPAGLLWILFSERKRAAALLAFVLAASAPIALHLTLRATLDLGFHQPDHGISSIRGVELAPQSPAQWPARWWSTWRASLPGATQLPEMGGVPALALGRAWVALALGLSLGALRGRRAASCLALLLLALYTLAYAASPFAHIDVGPASYVAYRHLAYVLPLLAVVAFEGARRCGRPGLVAGCMLCLVGAAALVLAPPAQRQESADRAAGWILASKLGHDPARLERLLDLVEPTVGDDLALGYGWGYAASRLGGHEAPATAQIEDLAQLVGRFSGRTRGRVIQGTALAFRPGVSPILDPLLSPVIEQRLAHLAE